MAEKGNELGAFLSGFIIGGLLGAAAALLLAPQSGEETRTAIREKSIELKDRTAETVEEARKRAEEAARIARERAEEAARLARQQAEELQKRGQMVLEEQKSRLEEAIETGKKAAQSKREEILGKKTEETAPDAGEEAPPAEA